MVQLPSVLSLDPILVRVLRKYFCLDLLNREKGQQRRQTTPFNDVHVAHGLPNCNLGARICALRRRTFAEPLTDLNQNISAFILNTEGNNNGYSLNFASFGGNQATRPFSQLLLQVLKSRGLVLVPRRTTVVDYHALVKKVDTGAPPSFDTGDRGVHY